MSIILAVIGAFVIGLLWGFEIGYRLAKREYDNGIRVYKR